MTKRMKFCAVLPGSRFKYRGRVYLKLRKNIATDEQEKRVLFPSEAEVEPVEGDPRIA